MEILLAICCDEKGKICSTAILEWIDEERDKYHINCWDPNWIWDKENLWHCPKPGHAQMTIIPAPKNIKKSY